MEKSEEGNTFFLKIIYKMVVGYRKILEYLELAKFSITDKKGDNILYFLEYA
jgi:hypothetical protein